jgi:hypothetical protein
MLLWATVNGGTTNYRYDADDVRKLKIDGSTRFYLHGLGGQLLSEFAEDVSGLRAVRDDVYAGARLVAAVRPSTPPFGSFDTPANGATGLAGEIMVTGWALDEHGVSKVQIFRDPVAGEAPGLLVYIGDGVFVPGARPDVENTFKSYPNADRAGWGYALLSNFLPNGGNGTYTLHARVTDDDGNTTSLGTKTIGVSNASSPKPFGTLDTPGQGQTVSGSAYMVWGWALTPQPDIIPVDGSTIDVYVDNVPLGHPVYNLYRADLAAAFPGLRNTNGAAGYFVLDTPGLSNGLHTIAWSVTDSPGGHSQGIGSRWFWVQN